MDYLHFFYFIWAFALQPHLAYAYWRMACSTVQTGRVDPILDLGTVSGHVHKIAGGNNFNQHSDFDSLRASTCSSCEVQKDTSAYWTPLLYYAHSNGTFEEVPNYGMTVYYVGRGGTPENTVPFPPGFQMISGDTRARSFDEATMTYLNTRPVADRVSFRCINEANDIPEEHYMFRTDCVNGLRAQINFQSCWDGVNLYLENSQHVAYLSGIDYGECPPSHPVPIPGLFFEVLYFTNWIDQSAGGQFVFANGDPTGYGFHADFMNGWDMDVQKGAVANCLYTDDGGQVSACSYLSPSDDVNFARTCPEQPPVFDEPVHGLLNSLPGCNPVNPGPGLVVNPTCPLNSNTPSDSTTSSIPDTPAPISSTTSSDPVDEPTTSQVVDNTPAPPSTTSSTTLVATGTSQAVDTTTLPSMLPSTSSVETSQTPNAPTLPISTSSSTPLSEPNGSQTLNTGTTPAPADSSTTAVGPDLTQSNDAPTIPSVSQDPVASTPPATPPDVSSPTAQPTPAGPDATPILPSTDPAIPNRGPPTGRPGGKGGSQHSWLDYIFPRPVARRDTTCWPDEGQFHRTPAGMVWPIPSPSESSQRSDIWRSWGDFPTRAPEVPPPQETSPSQSPAATISPIVEPSVGGGSTVTDEVTVTFSVCDSTNPDSIACTASSSVILTPTTSEVLVETSSALPETTAVASDDSTQIPTSSSVATGGDSSSTEPPASPTSTSAAIASSESTTSSSDGSDSSSTEPPASPTSTSAATVSSESTTSSSDGVTFTSPGTTFTTLVSEDTSTTTVGETSTTIMFTTTTMFVTVTPTSTITLSSLPTTDPNPTLLVVRRTATQDADDLTEPTPLTPVISTSDPTVFRIRGREVLFRRF